MQMTMKLVKPHAAKTVINNMAKDEAELLKMDSRCPRKLEHLPDSFCPLAVLRLKRLRQSEKELTEEEENKLPGCCWAINHQMSCYCFFKYTEEYLDSNNPPSDIEIAHMNSVSVESVKKTTKKAIEKFKKSDLIKQLEDNFASEEIVNPQDSDTEYSIRH